MAKGIKLDLEIAVTDHGDLSYPVRSTFTRIRRDLDSRYSYLIFESTTKSDRKKDFREIHTELTAPEAGVLKQTFYIDSESGQILLVAQISPNSDQVWKDRMFAGDLPKGVNFYFTKEQIGVGTRG